MGLCTAEWKTLQGSGGGLVSDEWSPPGGGEEVGGMNQHKGWTRVMRLQATPCSDTEPGGGGEGSGGWSRQALSSALVVDAVDQRILHEEVCNQLIF